MPSIGDRLREERERLDLSQPAMADACGITMRSQRNYEKSERFPDASYLSAVATLGADVQYILTGNRSSSVLAIDKAEWVLLENYRRCSPQAQANLLQTSSLLAAGLAANITPSNAGKYSGANIGGVVEGDFTGTAKVKNSK